MINNTLLKERIKSFIFYQIFVRLMILYVTVDFVLLCPLIFSKLWDLNEVISEYEQTLIMDYSNKQSKNINEQVYLGEWRGTKKGCDCTNSTQFNNQIYIDLCKQYQINGGCKKVYSNSGISLFKIYNTNFYQKTLKRNYLDLLKQISSFNRSECEGGYKKCGILDTLKNPLCIEKENNCPINDIVINNQSSLKGYKTLKFKDKNLYFHYTNNKIENMVITNIFFSSQNNSEGNDTKEVIDNHILYKNEEPEEEYSSKLIFEFPKEDIYEENLINEKILNLPFYNISNDTLYLKKELGFLYFNRDNNNFKYMFIFVLVHPRIYIILTIAIIIILDYYYGFYLLKNDSKGENCHLYLGLIIHSIVIILKGYFVNFWKVFMYLCVQERGDTAEYGKILSIICLSLSCVLYLVIIIMITLGIEIKKKLSKHKPLNVEIVDSKDFNSNHELNFKEKEKKDN